MIILINQKKKKEKEKVELKSKKFTNIGAGKSFSGPMPNIAASLLPDDILLYLCCHLGYRMLEV